MHTLPTINARYWAFVISSTTLGETAGDLISQTLDLGYAGGSILLIALFFVAMAFEIALTRQREALYWTVIIFASIGGTTLSDYVTRSLGLGYPLGTLVIGAALTVVLVTWWLSARSLDIKGAFSRRTELLYWLAILASSTLGTVFGDLISNGTKLGFAGGTLVLLGLLAALVVVVLFTNVSRTACYWLGIIITHPLGATMGDSMTKNEGLNLGNVWSSVILLAVFGTIIGASRLFRTSAVVTA